MLDFNYLVRASDKRITNDGEYSDSEDEGEGRRDEKNHKSPRKKARTASPIQNMVTDSTKKEAAAVIGETKPTPTPPIAQSTDKPPVQSDTKGTEEPVKEDATEE